MGKNKGGYNLFESYLASGLASQSSSSMDTQYIPLPDSMRTSTLLEQIGQDHKWSEQQINQDIQTMELNRLYYVSDLRELSKSSWKAIELLPIVKDLLRKALNSEGPPEKNKKDKKDKEKKKQKKKEKKDKKKKMKNLGVPITNGSFALSDGRDEKPLFTEGVVSEDPETIRNTIQNLKVDTTIEEPLSPTSPGGRKKSVSFSELDPVTVGGTPSMRQQMTNGNGLNTTSSSSSSSSSDSSSDSDCDEKKSKQQQQQPEQPALQKKPKVFTGRPIKAVSSNRIRIQTNDGDVFEADRFCPHKKVDLVSWGQVVGRSLICTKHNWNFSLDTGFAAKGGRSINPCKVNDW
ncbi:hypothetical protein HMPREF1544_07286 [Mucor circinelloides 1006PhL]|uniref:Rieske domain-containing protein n=1 Tax=Mucor circinelloides f. circinelloides (strain 1006PhL) TaxID=1220926 RepID=S2J8J2_MUCC1|nr:hypothetical protein HMPREF1544_07286 [Mucor circinelloides 1006PhL]